MTKKASANMSRFTSEEKNILKMAAEMLSEFSKELGNHGCNDHWIPNTPENVKLLMEAHELNGDPEDFDPPRKGDKELYVPDSFLVWFLSEKILHLSKEGEPQFLSKKAKSVVEAEEGEG
jgi:hypothetical protein